MKKFVLGHKNPDTDSVISAIVFSIYLKKIGINAEPVFIGKINRETQFVLNFFKEDIPRSIKKCPPKSKFYLVDHAELGQSIPNLKEENILGVVDHHQMGGLKTIEPIFYRCEVIGSTSTLIAKMFKEKRWVIGKKVASLLSAGIISDTLNLTSKTTTSDDKKILKELARRSGINVGEFSQKMFKAKSDIRGMNLKKILIKDYKQYDHKGKNLGVGVVETIDIQPFLQKREEIFKLLREIKKEKKIDLLFFGLVDILKRNTFFYLIAEKEVDITKKAFKLLIEKKSLQIGDIITFKGVTSRKKQIIPFLFNSI